MQTISSKAVAEMLGKRHDNFMRDLRKYIAMLGADASKYFIEGSYADRKGKARACYEVTLEGCNLIAGRIIGEDSTSFRCRFHEAFGIEEPAVNTEKSTGIDLLVEDVANRLGCPARTVYRLIRKGALRGEQKEILLPVMRVVISEEDLEAYMKEKGML